MPAPALLEVEIFKAGGKAELGVFKPVVHPAVFQIGHLVVDEQAEALLDGSFMANMERVLDVYKRPLDPLHPVVCMDESPKQLIGEVRPPVPASPGQPAKQDY